MSRKEVVEVLLRSLRFVPAKLVEEARELGVLPPPRKLSPAEMEQKQKEIEAALDSGEKIDFTTTPK